MKYILLLVSVCCVFGNNYSMNNSAKKPQPMKRPIVTAQPKKPLVKSPIASAIINKYCKQK